jgi:hypothetical protein
MQRVGCGQLRMQIEITPQVESLLDERRISLDDIRNVIEFAEETKNLFTNRVTGHRLAHLSAGTVTCWVEYGREIDVITIYGAYTHRMKIVQGVIKPPKSKNTGMDWSCLKCDRPLKWAMIQLAYLNQTFEADTYACPSCQRVFIAEKEAMGKMAMAEMMLEDK